METQEQKFRKLDELTSEADMLTNVLNDALKRYEHKPGLDAISFLTTLIRKKFDEIRAIF